MWLTESFQYSPRDIDLDTGLVVLVDDGEWEVLDVLLDILVVEFAANQSLDVKNGSVRI